jgi:hypothetical protein
LTLYHTQDKGDGFYNTGNLNAAINAYTTALEMDGGFIRCLANRAACYLQLGDTAACIADCTKARPPSPVVDSWIDSWVSSIWK